jgi:hypothetical protein
MQKDFFDELDNELSNAPAPIAKQVSETIQETQTSEVASGEEKKASSQHPKRDAGRTKNFNNKKQPRQFHQKQPRSSVDEESTTGEEEIDEGKPFNDDNYNFQKNILANFPQTKFYMPTLRDGYTRFIPIGGNNETGSKNMNMVQYGDEIILIDS